MNKIGSRVELPLWKFLLDTCDIGEKEGFAAPEFDDSLYSTVPAGKSWDQYDLSLNRRETVGWFRTEIEVAKSAETRHCLDFDGVGGIFAVYINGVKAAEELQRYLPHSLDIEDFLHDGNNTVAIKVDNRHRGTRHLTGGTVIEWILYGGLIHRVYLTESPALKIAHVFAKAESNGEVELRVKVENKTAGDFTGKLSASVAGTDVDFPVNCPAGETVSTVFSLKAQGVTSWSPEHPSLYDLTVTLVRSCGCELHRRTERIGFRTIEVRGTEIILNGKPIFFKGANRYDEYEPYGASVPEDKIREDLLLMKSCGMNFVRTHYEQDPATYRIADEIGIMYMLEVPLNWWAPSAPSEEEGGVGVLAPVGSEDGWKSLEEIARGNLDSTFEAFCNHPSWVVWSMSNECKHNTPDGLRILRGLAERARAKDSGRLITNVICIQPETVEELDYCDFIAINRYCGIFDALEQKAVTPDTFHERAYLPTVQSMNDLVKLFSDKPIVLSEFGARSVPGVHGNYPDCLEHHAAYLECVCKAFLECPSVRGLVIWCWADYFHNWDMGEPFGPYGIVTVDRKIKEEPFRAMEKIFASIPDPQ